MTDYTRIELTEAETDKAERDARTLIRKYGMNQAVKIIALLALENARLVKECNEHRKAATSNRFPFSRCDMSISIDWRGLLARLKIIICGLFGEQNIVCVWTIDKDSEDNIWDTACGDAFVLIEGSSILNDMIFCPYCGRSIQEKYIYSDDE